MLASSADEELVLVVIYDSEVCTNDSCVSACDMVQYSLLSVGHQVAEDWNLNGSHRKLGGCHHGPPWSYKFPTCIRSREFHSAYLWQMWSDNLHTLFTVFGLINSLRPSRRMSSDALIWIETGI